MNKNIPRLAAIDSTFQRSDWQAQSLLILARRGLALSIGLLLTALISLGSPTDVAAGQLALSWKDTDTTLTGFIIQRMTGTSGTYAQVGTVGASTFTYTDSNVTSGTTYCYQVLAYNAAGNSGPSNQACGTVATATYLLTVSVAGTGTGTVTSSSGGYTCTNTCSWSFAASTSVTLTATPASGSTFSGWSGCGSTGGGSCTVSMTAAQNVTATFASSAPPSGTTSNTLSVTVSGSGTVTSSPAGINCGSSCTASFSSTTSVTLTATPAGGYSFSGWSGGCTGTGSCVVSMAKAQQVSASFAHRGNKR